jgi:hypothetical protein
MKIAIINGSPRGKKSNTRLLLDQFIAGLEKSDTAAVYMTFYLVNRHQMQDAIDYCMESDCILMAFPLYTDSMPGIVKLFFENIRSFQGKKIGYMVQSGFPEGIHCFYIEKYLERFTLKLGAEYLGMVSRGNVEGIQDRSVWANKKLFRKYYNLGYYFGKNQVFDPNIMRELKKPFMLPPVARMVCRLVLKSGISDYGWNRHLKDNHVFKIKDARPYQH